MTIILLTGDGLEHRYVANKLCERVDISAVLVEKGISRTYRQRLAQLARRYSVAQLSSRALLAAYRRALRDGRSEPSQIAAVLGPDALSFRHPELISEVETVNRPSAHELVERLGPARLLVYGTGIVGDRMLERSCRTPLNMHTGISPHYRGSSCAFWPIHNGQPAMCGATVHEICSVVDGGAIYATATAVLDPADGLHAIFARTVVAGAEIFAETVERLSQEVGDPPGEPQDLSIGVEYRAHMRGLTAERRARRHLRNGLLGSAAAEPTGLIPPPIPPIVEGIEPRGDVPGASCPRVDE